MTESFEKSEEGSFKVVQSFLMCVSGKSVVKDMKRRASLDIKCMDVLLTKVQTMLVVIRVGAGPSQSTITSLLLF